MSNKLSIPVINVEDLIAGNSGKYRVAQEIGAACRNNGFFYISHHGVSEALQERLSSLSREFFALPLENKMKLRMELSGSARRGYIATGNELTSGKRDLKEAIYLGEEFQSNHPALLAQLPLHGQNPLPDEDLPAFRPVFLEYIDSMVKLGHRLVEGLALSLNLDENYFYDRYTYDPLLSLVIFNYPKQESEVVDGSYGVGEHTDYGFLTILKQDTAGGLELKSRSKWIKAPPIPGTFVCNIGDMLDRMTGGLYRSTPHRVKCPTTQDRLSIPFFFDPSFNSEVRAIEGLDVNALRGDDFKERWDKASVHQWKGTYGDYSIRKLNLAFVNVKD